MSRIHEALKKAEQERALSQPDSRVESTRAGVEVAGSCRGSGSSTERGYSGCMASRWNRCWRGPVRLAGIRISKNMLFFGTEEHASGMEEFRTLRSRLYQAREKQRLSKLLITSALPKEGKSFTAANLAQVHGASARTPGAAD